MASFQNDNKKIMETKETELTNHQTNNNVQVIEPNIQWVEYPGQNILKQVTITIGDHLKRYDNNDLLLLFEKYE